MDSNEITSLNQMISNLLSELEERDNEIDGLKTIILQLENDIEKSYPFWGHKMNVKENLDKLSKRNIFIEEMENVESEIEKLADALLISGFSELSEKIRNIEWMIGTINFHFQENF